MHCYRILVVDDEPRICQLLSELLGRDGHTVDTVLCAEDALVKLEQDAYEMVITDLKMPGMDGFGLIESIKKTQPEIAAIMITAYATVETAVQALSHGADDYITKPFEISELKKVVGRTLEHRRLTRQNNQLVDKLQQANLELSRHKRRLSTGTEQAAESIEQVNTALHRRLQQLSAINEISQAVVSLLDLDQLLAVCLREVNEKMNVSSSSIMLLDDNKTHLVVRAASRAELVGHRQRVGERISGWVAKYKEPLLIDDIRTNRKFQPNADLHYQSYSLLSVPLISKGRLLGVINVTDRRQDGGGDARFTDDDMTFLGLVAIELAIAIENAMLHRLIQCNTLNAVSVLADSIDARLPSTMGHSRRVAECVVKLARALGMENEALEILRTAARLHDIGNVGICDSILTKPSVLTSQEMRHVRSHSVKGDQIIESFGFLERVRRVVRHHHERWDGSGYPDGLKGEEIPFLSRILLLADSWDAITSGRPYRAARSISEALQEIERGAGSQFDPNMTKIFIEMQRTALADGLSAAAMRLPDGHISATRSTKN